MSQFQFFTDPLEFNVLFLKQHNIILMFVSRCQDSQVYLKKTASGNHVCSSTCRLNAISVASESLVHHSFLMAPFPIHIICSSHVTCMILLSQMPFHMRTSSGPCLAFVVLLLKHWALGENVLSYGKGKLFNSRSSDSLSESSSLEVEQFPWITECL